MTIDYDRAIKAAQQTATEHRKWCESHLNRGGNANSPEFKSRMKSAEDALNEAERWRALEADAVRERDARRAIERARDDTPVSQMHNGNGGAPRNNAERLSLIAGTPFERSGARHVSDDGLNFYTPLTASNDPTNDSEYKEDFLAYLHSHGRHVGRRLYEVNAAFERFDLTMISDGDGVGYLMPGDIRKEIASRLPAVFEFLDLVTVIPAHGDVVKYPRVRASTASGYESIYSSAGVGVMVGEAPNSATPTEPKFGTFPIPIQKARYLAKPSMDAIADIPSLQAFLADDAVTNLALLMEAQGLVGSGIGNNVSGVLNHEDIAAATDVSGTTADQISNTVSDAGSAPKLLTWFYSVPAQYRRHPSFRVMFNSDSERRIRSLVDANSRFMWSADGGFGSPTDGFLNKPTAISEFLASGGTDANVVGLAGALSEIVLAVNGGFRVQIADQLYAENDLLGLFVRIRFGFGLRNPDAVRLARV